MNARPDLLRFRTVFISDTHLGTRDARTDLLTDFLRSVSCDSLFLVGDIIDCWRLRRSWYWDEAHDEAVRLILSMAQRGVAVTYVPGNHDEGLRNWLKFAPALAGIQLEPSAAHVTAAGQRLLVMHGDEFDSVVRYGKLIAFLGDHAYDFALVLNRLFNNVRRRRGYPYWSLSHWLKRQVKGAVSAIDRFEEALAAYARKEGFDGVVCGHIHHPQMRWINGVLYLNTGDWVESCTALVEHEDGRLELIDWSAHGERPAVAPRPWTRALIQEA